MSFSPPSLTQADLEDLATKFFALFDKETTDIDEHGAREAFASILGYRADSPDKTSWDLAMANTKKVSFYNALEKPKTRKMLWRLMAAQMKCGIPTYNALGAIKEDCLELGFDPEMALLLNEVQTQMKVGGGNMADPFTPYVMPFDFEEAAILMIGAKLGSFQNTIEHLAQR